MTLEKGLRSQHSKAVQLHDSRGSPRAVNELPAISASIYHVIAISCNPCEKIWKIICKQVLHECVDSCTSVILERKWFKLTTCDWIRRILNDAT